MKIYKRQLKFRAIRGIEGMFGINKTAIPVDVNGVIRTVNHKWRINNAIKSLEFDIKEDELRLGCLLEQGKIYR